MELYIRNDSKYHLLYNCSFYNTSTISLEKRVNIPLGNVIMFVSITQLVRNFVDQNSHFVLFFKKCDR